MNSKIEYIKLKEYADFLNTDAVEVPEAVSQAIRSNTHNRLRLQKAGVFGKLMGIHFFMSTLSLLVCHQFDMNPFGSSISLSDYFMAFGHSTCMLLCGFLFLGGSFLTARIVLNQNDFLIIQRSFFLHVFVLCSLSLGAFMLLGAHVTLGMGLIWAIGAYVGSAISLINSAVRPKFS